METELKLSIKFSVARTIIPLIIRLDTYLSIKGYF